jgi:hypothetical protein
VVISIERSIPNRNAQSADFGADRRSAAGWPWYEKVAAGLWLGALGIVVTGL